MAYKLRTWHTNPHFYAISTFVGGGGRWSPSSLDVLLKICYRKWQVVAHALMKQTKMLRIECYLRRDDHILSWATARRGAKRIMPCRAAQQGVEAKASESGIGWSMPISSKGNDRTWTEAGRGRRMVGGWGVSNSIS